MRYSTDWEDYELIDCSDGYKLERWTNEILVRPDPQVIWKSKKENKYWFQPDATYLRSRTGGGIWKVHTKIPSSIVIYQFCQITFNSYFIKLVSVSNSVLLLPIHLIRYFIGLLFGCLSDLVQYPSDKPPFVI